MGEKIKKKNTGENLMFQVWGKRKIQQFRKG